MILNGEHRLGFVVEGEYPFVGVHLCLSDVALKRRGDFSFLDLASASCKFRDSARGLDIIAMAASSSSAAAKTERRPSQLEGVRPAKREKTEDAARHQQDDGEEVCLACAS